MPGSKVGIAALSGAVEPGRLDRGLERLRSLGYRPIPATNLGLIDGLFAGSEEERLDGFFRLVDDEDISAILFARGGHGLLPLLPRIDWERLGRRARWYIGYSDVTPLLNEVVRRLGWVTLHGPMAAVEFADDGPFDEEWSSLGGILERGEAPVLAAEGMEGSWSEVEAPLSGGCLSLLAATQGTEWAFRAAGTVLFLEDVDEPLYRIDRMLQQLRLAGALEGVAGVLVGDLKAADLESAGREGSDLPESPRTTVLDRLREALGPGVPIAWGCSSGHCRPNLTVPLGATVRAAAGGSTLELALPDLA